MNEILSVCTGALLVWLGDYVRHRCLQEKRSKFLAIKLISYLESFLMSCYDVAFDDGTHLGHPAGGDGTYFPQCQVPQISLPDDVDWGSIDQELLKKILLLPVELKSTLKEIDTEKETNAHPPYDEYMHFRMRKFAKYCLDLEEILDQLKGIISIKSYSRSEHWNPRKRCEDFLNK